MLWLGSALPVLINRCALARGFRDWAHVWLPALWPSQREVVQRYANVEAFFRLCSTFVSRGA
jgi:hypothetical protein